MEQKCLAPTSSVLNSLQIPKIVRLELLFADHKRLINMIDFYLFTSYGKDLFLGCQEARNKSDTYSGQYIFRPGP